MSRGRTIEKVWLHHTIIRPKSVRSRCQYRLDPRFWLQKPGPPRTQYCAEKVDTIANTRAADAKERSAQTREKVPGAGLKQNPKRIWNSAGQNGESDAKRICRQPSRSNPNAPHSISTTYPLPGPPRPKTDVSMWRQRRGGSGSPPNESLKSAMNSDKPKVAISYAHISEPIAGLEQDTRQQRRKDPLC